MGKKFLFIWLLAFICLFISFLCFANPNESLKLSISTPIPAEGQKVKFSVQLKPAYLSLVTLPKDHPSHEKLRLEIPLNIFIGEKPGSNGNLTNSKLWKTASLDEKGKFSFRTNVQEGFLGRTIYFKAFALVRNRILESSVEKITITPSNKDADWIVSPTTLHHVHSGKTVYISNPIEHAYQKASPGDVILLENGNYSDFHLKNNNHCEAEETIWIKARHPQQAKITKNNKNSLKISKKLCSTILVGLDMDPAYLYSFQRIKKSKVEQPIRFLECSLGQKEEGIIPANSKNGWGVYFHSENPLLFTEGKTL